MGRRPRAPAARARLHRVLQRRRSAAGRRLDSSLRGALRRSGTLFLDPRRVRKEVEAFRERHPTRPIVTVSVGGALQDAGIAAPTREWLSVDDKIWLAESDEAVERGFATEAFVDRLATAPTRFKSNSSWRWVVLASTDGSSTTNLN